MTGLFPRLNSYFSLFVTFLILIYLNRIRIISSFNRGFQLQYDTNPDWSMPHNYGTKPLFFSSTKTT